MLQAEYDRDRVRTLANLKGKEKKLMKNVEDFAFDLKTPMKGLLKDKSVPVYYTERYEFLNSYSQPMETCQIYHTSDTLRHQQYFSQMMMKM